MGTNYYLHQKSESSCSHCGHDPGERILHIGKSSYGWCFSLHVIPELGINGLYDWIPLWNNHQIKNEYDEIISPSDMLAIITLRAPGNYSPIGVEPRRNELDGESCIGHGEGSWDLIRGEFS